MKERKDNVDEQHVDRSGKGHWSEGSMVRKISVNCVEQQVWNTGHITRNTSNWSSSLLYSFKKL